MSIIRKWRTSDPWEVQELKEFYEAFASNCCNWEFVAAVLPKRSKEMFSLLYQQTEFLLRKPLTPENFIEFVNYVDEFQKKSVYVSAAKPSLVGDSKGKSPMLSFEDDILSSQLTDPDSPPLCEHDDHLALSHGSILDLPPAVEDDTTGVDTTTLISWSCGTRLIVCLGELHVEFPIIHGSSFAKSLEFLEILGGPPTNVAVAISQLGGSSALIGKVGNDEFGRRLVSLLNENGVILDGILVDRDSNTGLSLFTLKPNGDREVIYYFKANADMLLTVADIDTVLLKRADVFHYGSNLLISEPCRSAFLLALEIAMENGTLLSYVPNLQLPLWPSLKVARREIMRILVKSDFVKVSKEELEFLTNQLVSDDAAMSLWHPDLKLLIVSLGVNGFKYYTKNFRGSVGPFIAKAVDTNAAGDAFIGSLLFKIVGNQSIIEDEAKLRDAISFSNVCAAITAVQGGAIPDLPNHSEVTLHYINQ